MASMNLKPFVYDDKKEVEEFALAFFANIPEKYGYNISVKRYMFNKSNTFGKVKNLCCSSIQERNIHIKNEIIQTYINKNGEAPSSFEIAFFDFWGEKNVVYLSKHQWAVNQVKKMSEKHVIAGLPKFYKGSGKCEKSDEDAKAKMIAARNKHIHDYLIGKYRAPAKIEIGDLTKKMNSAKLDDSAKPAVSDSVESVDLDDYVLKTKAIERFNEIKSKYKKRIKEMKKKIKEMEKKMEKMIPEESFNQVVENKVSEMMNNLHDEEESSDEECATCGTIIVGEPNLLLYGCLNVKLCSTCYADEAPDFIADSSSSDDGHF